MMKEKNDFLSKTLVVVFGALICCALWGSAFPCIKLGYRFSNIAANDTAAQILYAGIRFTLAGILTVLLGSGLQRKFLHPTKSGVVKVMKLSLFQTILQYIFFYIGLAHASGVKASIIEGTNVFVAILIAGLVFHLEKVTAKKMIGCAIGFLGVVLVNMSGTDISTLFDGFAWNGEGFVFLSTFAYAISSVVLKHYSVSENPVMLSGYQFIFGGIVMIAMGFGMGGRIGTFDAKACGMLIWLALVSAVAYSLWGMLLKYNPVSKVAVFGFMNPVFGVILSAILLEEGEQLGLLCLISLVLVCIGIFIAQSKEKNAGKE